jgi:hypothetical protein
MTKDTTAPRARLNSKQRTLLVLIERASPGGCLIYGRGPTATAESLERRGLVSRRRPLRVCVVVMDRLETRDFWHVTEAGTIALRDGAPLPRR